MALKPEDRSAFARAMIRIVDAVLADSVDAETAAKRLDAGAQWLRDRDFGLCDGEQPSAAPDDFNVVDDDDVRAVFNHWVRVTNRPRARMTPGRRKKIRARLKDFSVTQLRAAIDVAAADPFWGGEENRSKAPQDQIERVLATTERVEAFVERAGDRLRQMTRADGTLLDDDESRQIGLLETSAKEALREGRIEDYNALELEIRRARDQYDA
jgi:hypothetical protein